MSESPFIAGVRVAVRQGDYEKWHEKFIDKVHKNGNFTLRGDKQQWKPNSSSWSGAVTWAAFQTGARGGTALASKSGLKRRTRIIGGLRENSDILRCANGLSAFTKAN